MDQRESVGIARREPQSCCWKRKKKKKKKKKALPSSFSSFLFYFKIARRQSTGSPGRREALPHIVVYARGGREAVVEEDTRRLLPLTFISPFYFLFVEFANSTISLSSSSSYDDEDVTLSYRLIKIQSNLP